MYRRDYILRLIEQFGRVLLALRDRILRREIAEVDVATQLGEIAARAGLDLEIARRLDPQSLLLWLAPTPDIDEGRLWLMAELLYLEGLQAQSERAAVARLHFERAAAIFQRLPPAWRPAADFFSAGERAAEIKKWLSDDPAEGEARGWPEQPNGSE